jgi:hypothetical protein
MLIIEWGAYAQPSGHADVTKETHIDQRTRKDCLNYFVTEHSQS